MGDCVERGDHTREAIMRRRDFVMLVGGSVVASPLTARAQPVRIPKVGVLWHAASAEEEAIYLGALRQGLRDVGYVEGKTIELENRFPAEIPERFTSLAADLAALKVDVLVAVTQVAALAAQRATTTIPIVFIVVADPVRANLVTSLARPGANITGLSSISSDLSGKRLELFKTALSDRPRVALLVNGNDPAGAQRYIAESQAAASRLGLTLRPVEVRGAGDFKSAFSKMSQDGVHGVVVGGDGLFFAERKQVADLALAQRLPVMVYSRETLEAGALMSYGPSYQVIFRRAGIYIDKILRGAKPANLPVEQPTTFEFLINRKTAKALGITIADTALAGADAILD
jgi:putative ABC transport system substrate-binding protein